MPTTRVNELAVCTFCGVDEGNRTSMFDNEVADGDKHICDVCIMYFMNRLVNAWRDLIDLTN